MTRGGARSMTVFGALQMAARAAIVAAKLSPVR
jgi:hypothetical protein